MDIFYRAKARNTRLYTAFVMLTIYAISFFALYIGFKTVLNWNWIKSLKFENRMDNVIHIFAKKNLASVLWQHTDDVSSKFEIKCPIGKRGIEIPVLTTDQPHIAVGVLCKDRWPYVKVFAQALLHSIERHSKWKKHIHVLFYDDGSNKLLLQDLINTFPMLEKLTHYTRSQQYRGSGIIQAFLHDCARTSYDICVFGDCDLVFHPDWIPNLLRHMNETDGQLTLYNSCSHNTGDCANGICEKKAAGSAGTAITRKLAEELSCNIPYLSPTNKILDWNWIWYLRDTKRKMYTLNPSMAEHIGIYQASNGNNSMKEQSRNFDVFSLNQPLATLIYYHLMSRNHSSCNHSKVIKPKGWAPDPVIELKNLLHKDYFLDSSYSQSK